MRKGMGLGRGSGYYNIAPMDSHIHSLSAKGCKTYSRGDKISTRDFKEGIVTTVHPYGYDVRVFDGSRIVGEKVVFKEDKIKKLRAKSDTPIAKELTTKFTQEQLKAFRILNYNLEGGVWSLAWTKKPSEIFVLQTQLGISTSQARKLAKSYLDVLDKYPSKEGLQFMGYMTGTKSLNYKTSSPLQKTTRLEVLQVVTVPSTEYSKPISTSKFNKRVKDVQTYLAKTFGGETSVTGQGGYVSMKDGKLIKEKVNVVTSFADDKGFGKKQDRLVNQLDKWRKDWKQESVAYQVEDDLYLVGV